jgi:hypothetical protein
MNLTHHIKKALALMFNSAERFKVFLMLLVHWDFLNLLQPSHAVANRDEAVFTGLLGTGSVLKLFLAAVLNAVIFFSRASLRSWRWANVSSVMEPFEALRPRRLGGVCSPSDVARGTVAVKAFCPGR